MERAYFAVVRYLVAIIICVSAFAHYANADCKPVLECANQAVTAAANAEAAVKALSSRIEALEKKAPVLDATVSITNNCVGGQGCEAKCTDGRKVVGGGCWLTKAWAHLEQEPADATTWRCVSSDAAATVRVTAICAIIR